MMLLTDPKGRQTGYDITTGKVLQQIPNSNFSSEATTNIEDTKYPAPVDYFIDIHNPLDGIYELTLIRGENSNYYDLTMVTFTEYGDRESTDEIKGSMISGSDRVFQIDFTSASNVSSTVSLIK